MLADPPVSSALASPAQEATPTSAAPLVLRVSEVLRRHWLAILGTTAAAIIAALIITLLSTPLYTASTRIEIARQSGNVTNVEGLQRNEDVQSIEYYATQHELLNARSLAERVVRRLRLASNDNFLSAFDLSTGGFLSGAGDRAPTRGEIRDREALAADALLKSVDIAPLRGSALVDVRFTSADPGLSAQIANAWVDEFIQQTLDRRFESTGDARTFLETRLVTLRDRLEKSERDLVNYARAQNIVRLTEERSADGRTTTTQTLASRDLEILNNQLGEATAARIAAEGRRDAARSSRATEALINNTAIAALRQSRAQLASQYAQLMQRFEPQYPEARALQQQIAAIDASIASEERRVRSATDSEFEAASSRERQLRARVNSLLGQLDEQNRASIQFNIYQRDVDTNRQLYEALLQRYKEIGVAGVGTNNVSIIDRAKVPTSPSSPNLWLNLALALVAGLALSGLVVFIIENLDETIRQPRQVTETLGVPLLGAVPESELDEPLQSIADPKSILSEAYMSARTNLAFVTDHGAPRSFSVTSSAPGEGKSTTSLGLATALARTGKSVVVVDLDLRRPTLHKRLGANMEKGVSNFLAGDSALDTMLAGTDFANLSFMSSGPIPPSAPELLTGGRLNLLMTELTQRFDHVVVDGPPLLALSDAQLIGQAVEGVVFVVQSARTPIRAVNSSIRAFRSNGIRLFGVVLTKYRAQISTYGYGYNYESQYRYDGEQ